MTTCLIVSDSFKGTLSSLEICRIAEEVVPAVIPDGRAVALPMADGGEGTVQSVLRCTGGEPVTLDVTGPFPGGTVRAAYGRFGGCAVIEMASAAGLPLAAGRLDPLHATTFGVGELIRHAVERGCREIYLGLGGSCTNDGGSGCAAALGVRYATCSGLIPSGGAEGAESRATRLSAEELTEILQSAVAAAHELSMELDFTSPGWLPEQTLHALGLHLIPSCGACLSNMAVAPDGTVIPCQSWLGGTALGNILTDDWPAIWDGEACRAIRAESAKMEHICQLQTGNRGKEGC